MTFDMNDLPPVSQFWSIPIYNKAGYFVRNPIDRLHHQQLHDRPEAASRSRRQTGDLSAKRQPSDPNQLKNWLPAPKDGFRFAARFYGPKMAIIEGSYKMPKAVMVK